MKKWIFSLMAAVLLLTVPVSVFAHDVPDVNRTNCSIEAVLRYEEQPVAGGELIAVRVGYIYQDNGNYAFRRFVDDAQIEDVASADAVQVLEQFFQDHREQYTFDISVSTVGEDGKAQFEDLETGLYLILQETPAPGYSALKPFLVTLPYMHEGQYCYSVSSAVKTELEREPVPTEPEPTEPSGGKLPQTGQLNWPVPVLAAAGLGCLLLGFALRSRSKNTYEE